MISYNVASLHRHREALLQVASERRAEVLLVQESGVSENQMPGMAAWFRRHGWQFLGTPARASTDGGRGGLAILVREPLAASVIDQAVLPSGHLLRVRIYGSSLSLQVICVYRRPAASMEVLTELEQRLTPSAAQHWLAAGDFNLTPYKGPLAETMRALGGALAGVARHTKSPMPVDSCWTSPSLQASGSSDVDAISDHTGIEVRISIPTPKGPSAPAWEFRPRPKFLTDTVPCDVPWQHVACLDATWQELLSRSSPGDAWQQWSLDAETWLGKAGLLGSSKATHPRGQEPRLQSAAPPQGVGQSLRERQLRRFLRRLEEARTVTRRGHQVQEQLRNALARDAPRWGVRSEVSQGHWGLAHARSLATLDRVLDEKQREALQGWRTRMSDYPSACRWIKATVPAPWLLRTAAGEDVAGKARGVQAIAQEWQPIFQGPPGYVPDTQRFLDTFGSFVPQRSPDRLPALNPGALKAIISSMRAKASGPCGWGALPDPAWARLVEVLEKIEASGEWPLALSHWRLVFLPNNSYDGPCLPGHKDATHRGRQHHLPGLGKATP